MSEKKIIQLVEEGYFAYVDGAPKKEVLKEKIAELFKLDTNSKEYFVLKAEVISNLAYNALEEFARGKYNSGKLTYKIFDELNFVLMEKEDE